MKILAISGSGRASSTNTAMLRAVAEIAQPKHEVTVFDGTAGLPVFSPDFEVGPLPVEVQAFVDMIGESHCVIISSPEYVRSIPGGLKNAIDWLVSRDEIVQKPIALMHASHRGEDMLEQLRLVLSTVSQKFAQDLFLRFEFMKLSPEEISDRLAVPTNRAAVADFLRDLTNSTVTAGSE
ncbi:NADPH-dependent FMN reductase [Rhizobium nepotum]|jgi:NAD(P)H-dependent FMN reductase|uniref:FMN reductase n=1 Tax=Rhizobium nepotum 39/7 TaxID=1368418 RepID=A0ABR5CSS0_9HYPH|nr:NADPH-dependent FMN reductase [Rhizobium nepotum]KJF67642.1 FMN reductase [Rhizobium nepotum 39/7]